jgi:hypothetical protein
MKFHTYPTSGHSSYLTMPRQQPSLFSHWVFNLAPDSTLSSKLSTPFTTQTLV